MSTGTSYSMKNKMYMCIYGGVKAGTGTRPGGWGHLLYVAK